MSAGRRTGAWFCRWWWMLAAGVLLVGVFAVAIALTVLAASNTAGDGHWARSTGPVGDTSGGLLGPILSTAALVTTAYLPVWQPRKDRAEERASEVVAWIAETHDRLYRGLVIANTSGSVAQNVDIGVRGDTPVRDKSEDLRDRENTVPLGTWFVPYRVSTEESPGRRWMLPVAVDTTDGMSVQLTEPGAGEPTAFNLRTHLPEMSDGEDLPYDILTEFRFALHGSAWSRDEAGGVMRAPRRSEAEEAEWVKARNTVRLSAQSRTVSKKVSRDVEALMRHTVEFLCAASGAPHDRDVFALADEKPQAINPALLPGARTIRRATRGGSGLILGLDGGRQLRLAQNGTHYPGDFGVYADATLTEPAAARTRIGRAGAKVIGEKSAGALGHRDAGFWLESPKNEALRLLTLRAMVAEALASDITTKGPDDVD